MFTVTVTNKDQYPELGLESLFCVEAINFSTLPVVTETAAEEEGVAPTLEFSHHRFTCTDPLGNPYAWNVVGTTVIRVLNSDGKTVAEFSAPTTLA